jgi:hypothetical protein
MILTFGLNKIDTSYTDLMLEWMNVSLPVFSVGEQYVFDDAYLKGVKGITTWSEEDLKMKFISPVLSLGQVIDEQKFASFFDKKLEAKVDGYNLVVKADFLIAKGLLNYMKRPYFYFQVEEKRNPDEVGKYKPQKQPTGDPMAQLLEAFLIGQTKNDDGKPLYGCEVVGRNWTFITMEARTYCISKTYDSTDKEDLLKIIAILRKFRYILETRLLI